MQRLIPFLFSVLMLIPSFLQAEAEQVGKNPLSPSPTRTNGGFDPGRLLYGGNFGLQFGNPTMINISPMIGYRLTDRLISGVGISYMYYRYRTSTYQNSSSLYGGRIYSRYYVVNNIFLHGEIETLSFSYIDPFTYEQSRYWFTTPMLGGGYTTNGIRGGAMVSALYAFRSDDPRSPYYLSPLVLRIGFFF